jgi:hypothetical protein
MEPEGPDEIVVVAGPASVPELAPVIAACVRQGVNPRMRVRRGGGWARLGRDQLLGVLLALSELRCEE